VTAIVSVVPTRDEMARPATASPASNAIATIFRCVVRSALYIELFIIEPPHVPAPVAGRIAMSDTNRLIFK